MQYNNKMIIALGNLSPQSLPPGNAVVFGGSFDPVHQGHLGVLKKLLPKFENVFLAPTTANPWKVETPTPFEDRLAMLKIAVETHFERGTIKLLEEGYHYVDELVFQLRHELGSGTQLWWAVGEDIAAEVHRWRNFETLDLHIVVAQIEPNIHASDIRAGLSAPLECLRKYIEERRLYTVNVDAVTHE